MEMPGHDVGMVLHDREQDFVTLADMSESEGRRHEIDRLGRGARENNLVDGFRIEKAPHAGARRLKSVGRGICQVVQAAMHVGVFVLVDMRHALDHLTRFLRGGGVVEVDEFLAVRLFRQDREVGAQLFDVVGAQNIGRRVHRPLLWASQSSVWLAKRARTDSSATRSSASLAKASSNRDSASPRERPRACK